jgi:hypothetical protein
VDPPEAHLLVSELVMCDAFRGLGVETWWISREIRVLVALGL